MKYLLYVEILLSIQLYVTSFSNLYYSSLDPWKKFCLYSNSVHTASSTTKLSSELLIEPFKLIRYRYKKARTQYKTDLLNNQTLFSGTTEKQSFSNESSSPSTTNKLFAANGNVGRFDELNFDKSKNSKKPIEYERNNRMKALKILNNYHEDVDDDEGLPKATKISSSRSESTSSAMIFGGNINPARNQDFRYRGRRNNRIRGNNMSGNDNIREKLIILPAFEDISINDLSELTNLSAGEIIRTLMITEGRLMSLQQKISRIEVTKLLDCFEIKWKDGKTLLTNTNACSTETSHDTRCPVVTIMGHVDHGKTTLLDYIRNTNVVETETGGITQAISIFNVPTRFGRNITFLDTPGHAAFKEMRSRGTKMTDIVVLVIAADDGIMKQTVECIEFARESGCPIVVAINKIDKAGGDVDAIKTNLLNLGVVLEEFGGDTQCALLSAKSGVGVDDLLQKILIQADVLELKKETSCAFEGSIVESTIDKGRGVAVVGIVQKGELKIGDIIVAGPVWGRVKLLMNEYNEIVEKAIPSMPVKIIGFECIPKVGEKMVVVSSEDEAQNIAKHLSMFSKSHQPIKTSNAQTILATSLKERGSLSIPFLVKADAVGTLEAVRETLQNITISSNDKIYSAEVVYSNLGTVSKADIHLAAASKSMIVAFNVDAPGSIIEMGRSENVKVQRFDLLYDLVDYVTAQLNQMVEHSSVGDIAGIAEVKKIFNVGKVNKIGGCFVSSGKMVADYKIRVMRQKKLIFCGKIASLKVQKSDVSEVLSGNDCGVALDGFNDFAEGDVFECFI